MPFLAWNPLQIAIRVLIVLLLNQYQIACADFKFSIDASFDFVSCNSVETVIARKNSEVVFSPRDYPKVGPIKFFAKVESKLCLKTAGRKRRYPGQPNRTLEMEDPSLEFYFFIDNGDEVVGPLTSEEFYDRIQVHESSVHWQRALPPIPKFILVVVVTLILVGIGAILIRRILSKDQIATVD